MSDKREITTILEARQSMVQYIGAIITKLNRSGEEARQIVCAILLEEALRLVTIDNKIEMFSAKPILRAAMRVLEMRLDEYEQLSREQPEMIPVLTKAKIEVLSTIKTLKKLTDDNEGGTKDGRNS